MERAEEETDGNLQAIDQQKSTLDDGRRWRRSMWRGQEGNHAPPRCIETSIYIWGAMRSFDGVQRWSWKRNQVNISALESGAVSWGCHISGFKREKRLIQTKGCWHSATRGNGFQVDHRNISAKNIWWALRGTGEVQAEVWSLQCVQNEIWWISLPWKLVY